MLQGEECSGIGNDGKELSGKTHLHESNEPWIAEPASGNNWAKPHQYSLMLMGKDAHRQGRKLNLGLSFLGNAQLLSICLYSLVHARGRAAVQCHVLSG